MGREDICTHPRILSEGSMSMSEYRDMTDREKALLRKLLTPDFPGRDALASQIETAEVTNLDADGSLGFLVHAAVGANAVKYVVPTEGEYEDPDGVTVHILLHMRANKVAELEFYREDNNQVQSWPASDSLRVFAPQ